MTTTVSFEFRRTGPQEFQWEVEYTNDRPGCQIEVTFGLASRALFFQSGRDQNRIKGAGVWRNEDGMNLDAPGGYIPLVAIGKAQWSNPDMTTGFEQAVARALFYVTGGQTLVTASDQANQAVHS